MANAERGEVDLAAGDQVYTLALSMNAICQMQTRTGKTYGQILDIMPQDFTAFRDMMFMLLQRYHVKQFSTLLSVGEMIDGLPNGMNDAAKAIRKVLELNAERGNKVEGNGNPPTAQS